MRTEQEVIADIEAAAQTRRDLHRELSLVRHHALIGKTFTGELGTLTVTGIDANDRLIGTITGYTTNAESMGDWWSEAGTRPNHNKEQLNA